MTSGELIKQIRELDLSGDLEVRIYDYDGTGFSKIMDVTEFTNCGKAELNINIATENPDND